MALYVNIQTKERAIFAYMATLVFINEEWFRIFAYMAALCFINEEWVALYANNVFKPSKIGLRLNIGLWPYISPIRPCSIIRPWP